MRRPLCRVAVLFAMLMGLSVILFPDEGVFPENAGGRVVVLTGTVQWKEYKVTIDRESREADRVLQIAVRDIEVERGLPEEMRGGIFAEDKILCVLNDDLAGQDHAAGIGCRVRLRGRVSLFRTPTCDGQFDSNLYYHQIQGYLFRLDDTELLAASRTGGRLMNALYRLREKLSDAVDSIYPDPETASVMKAVLLGQTGLLDPDVKRMYQANGLIHIICISGLHISLIGMGLFSILRKTRVPVPAAAIVSITVIILYGLMTGMHASSFRAVLMFLFHITAILIGRTYDTFSALSAAAILLLIHQPLYIEYSGFQYSFGAVIAIGLVSEYFPAQWRFLSVPVVLLPVQLWHGFTFPVYSILINMAVIPLMTPVMGAGLLALGLYMIPGMKGGAAIAGKGASLILALYRLMCEKAQLLPGHTMIAGRPSPQLIILYYAMIALAALMGQYIRKRESVLRKTTLDLRGRLSGFRAAAVQAAVIFAAVLMLLNVRLSPSAALYMLDVGQGDGLFIEAGRGRDKVRILVDGGSSDRLNLGEYTLKPFLMYHGAGYVDLAVLTHDDYDHCSGLMELIEKSGENGEIQIGALALPQIGERAKGERFEQIEEMAARRHIPVIYVSRGKGFAFGDLELECLHPAKGAVYEDPNSYSLTMMLRCGDLSAMLTGDLEGTGEDDLLSYMDHKASSDTVRSAGGTESTPVTVLKVAHHGSGGATSERFLKRVDPAISLISCGVNNRYGHPAPELIERLSATGTKIFDTRDCGQITVTYDGRKVRVKRKRR